jgi:arginase
LASWSRRTPELVAARGRNLGVMFTVSTSQWIGATRKGYGIKRGAELLAAECEQLGIAIHATLAPTEPDETREHNIVGRASLLGNVEALRSVLRANAPGPTLLLGGDCASDLAPIAHHITPELSVVYFDAHGDLNQPSESPSGALHGMVLRHLLGDGDAELVSILGAKIKPEQIRYRGVRECDQAEMSLIEQLSIVCEHINATPPDGPIYIHLDLDVLDPSEFPHTTYPTPGGPSVAELNTAISTLLETSRVVGVAITECATDAKEQLAPLRPLLQTIARWAVTKPQMR